MEIKNYYKQMQSDSVVISYKGAASDKLMDSLINMAQAKLTAVEHKKNIKKKLVTVLVEILQNVQNHANQHQISSEAREIDSIVFIIAKNGDSYSLMAGNFVNATEVQKLKVRIDEVNGMSREEIKSKYLEILENGEISDKGGAGLGIVEIARKAGSKLDYEFSSHSDTLSFFSLMVNISAT